MGLCSYQRLFSILIPFCFSCLDFSAAIDTITSTQFLKDPQTLTSNGTRSELGKGRDMTIIITVSVIIGTIIIVTCAYFLWKWTGRHSRTDKTSDNSIIGELSEQELLQYDFEKLATATNNFHSSNKLGQGGFGPVYKGKLQDGREIAVKRLSTASKQGGRRNSSFYNNEESLGLLGIAWKLWNEENIVTLIDPELHEPGHEKDILRCLQIGLICAQELARERPNMATVISMLNSEIVDLPSPRQPAFTERQNMMSSESTGERSHGLHSNNSVSITEIQAR
ncbi:hypothetical protein L6164_032734 [Bauhinia variegata]|uniref:Uncharacterized protein n=1 Tax=Bauhinia variegata TaxID=167791 RepID=A0ACB9KPK2_BAUVA|nr:hypothetical protein L6164_032734 [Bauhinia variegata]